MSLYTAQRKRLVGPLGICLLAALFGVSFFVLKADRVPGVAMLAVKEDAGEPSVNIDELGLLDVAYLKAGHAAGTFSDAQLGNVVVELLRAHRVDEARRLLVENASLDIPENTRRMIDLEMSAHESPAAMMAALRQLSQLRPLPDSELMQRAVILSEKYSVQASLTHDLYKTAANLDSDNSVDKLMQCGQSMLNRQEQELAIDCFQSALNHAQGDSLFEVNLALAPLLDTHSIEQNQLLDELFASSARNVNQLSRLAPVLLSLERPDMAYRVYARLALADSDDEAKWLLEAATWAEASGRPLDASVFLNAVAERSEGDERDKYLRETIRVRVAAGRSEAALDAVQDKLQMALSTDAQGGSVENLDALLEQGVSLAQESGNTQQAFAWNNRRLQNQPDNVSIVELQGELAMQLGDLPTALRLAQQASRLSPDEPSARVRLARISEWNAQLEAAISQWQWLSDPRNQSDQRKRSAALKEVVRLASATLQFDLATQAMRELTVFESPTDTQILQLVSLYEQQGLTGKVAEAIEDISLLHGDSALLRRTVALHEYKHKRYAQSLEQWRRLRHRFGASDEAFLYSTELLWRLGKPEAAIAMAEELRGRSLLTVATDYQIRLLAEMSWRYRLPWLSALVQPQIARVNIVSKRNLYARRVLEELQDQGDDYAAMNEAIRLWNSTGEAEFAVSAMSLALRRDNTQSLNKFLPDHGATEDLKKQPEYWVTIAQLHQRNSKPKAARAAYRQALELSPDNVLAINGLLWMDIEQANPVRLQHTLQQHEPTAQYESQLWPAMAVGYLQLGAAATSLEWFDKFLDQIDTDYGMLLTYADALEYAGLSAEAERARQYTIVQLRPLLIEGASDNESLLIRQYIQLVRRYAGTDQMDSLVSGLLEELENGNLERPAEKVWREDIAISWLMSTQQFEQARVVMTRLHSQRLQSPAWQQLALALNDKDKESIEAILDNEGVFSVGNHILALRQLGFDRKAYALAQQALQPDALNPGVSPYDLESIAQQYTGLRSSMPSYASGFVRSTDISGLRLLRNGFSLRHSLSTLPLGIGVELAQRQIDSDSFTFVGDEQLGDVALSLFFGNSRNGGTITAGLMNTSEANEPYASAAWFTKSSNEKRRYDIELGYHETPTDSAELFLAGQQNRIRVGMDASLGRLPFMRLQADARQIQTRLDQQHFADGAGAQLEVGLRGSLGSHNWSTSVLMDRRIHDRTNVLPSSLRLFNTSTANSVLPEDTSTLSVGATLARGDVNANFIQGHAPRYFVGARVGQQYPSRDFAFSFGAGAGIRILGGDELSFSINHDTTMLTGANVDSSSADISYRFHF